MRWVFCLVVIASFGIAAACEDDTLYKVGKPAERSGGNRGDGGAAADSSPAEAIEAAPLPDGGSAE